MESRGLQKKREGEREKERNHALIQAFVNTFTIREIILGLKIDKKIIIIEEQDEEKYKLKPGT